MTEGALSKLFLEFYLRLVYSPRYRLTTYQMMVSRPVVSRVTVGLDAWEHLTLILSSDCEVTRLVHS